jgi:hypothetical protein
MTIQIIQTSQAPDAKPIGLSKKLSTEWETVVEVPSFEVPQQSFGGGTNIVPGVAEIISPMLICNLTASTETVSIKIFRNSANSEFFIVNELPIPSNDILPIPLNGQFIYTGDLLMVTASSNNAIDITMSYTIGQAEEDDVT